MNESETAATETEPVRVGVVDLLARSRNPDDASTAACEERGSIRRRRLVITRERSSLERQRGAGLERARGFQSSPVPFHLIPLLRVRSRLLLASVRRRVRIAVGQVRVLVISDARQRPRNDLAVRLYTRFRRAVATSDILDNRPRVNAYVQPARLIVSQQFGEPELKADILGGVVPRSGADGSAVTDEWVPYSVHDTDARPCGAGIATSIQSRMSYATDQQSLCAPS